MSKNNWVDYKEIKAKVSIEQILGHYGLLDKLRRKGDNLIGPCPIHGGNNPGQFHVSTTKNAFHCFGNCKKGGNIIDFVCAMEKLDRDNQEEFRKAALLIQEWFLLETRVSNTRPEAYGFPSGAPAGGAEAGSPGPGERQGGAPGGPEPQLVKEEAGENQLAKEKKEGAHSTGTKNNAKGKEEVVNPPLKFSLKNLDPDHPYLAERGLTKETIEVFGIGGCQKGMMAGRIAIPIHNDAGELVAYSGRWPGDPPEGEDRYKLPPGFRKSLVLFNFHRAKEFVSGSGFRHAGKGSGKTRFPVEENSERSESQKPWVSEESDRSLILVEGLFDCMRVWQAGFQNVVALLGSQLSLEQEKMILEAVGPGGKVSLMFDEDAAGWACRDEVLDRLASQVFVKIIRLGEEGLQPDGLSEEEIRRLLS